jgi:hypothetical protein
MAPRFLRGLGIRQVPILLGLRCVRDRRGRRSGGKTRRCPGSEGEPGRPRQRPRGARRPAGTSGEASGRPRPTARWRMRGWLRRRSSVATRERQVLALPHRSRDGRRERRQMRPSQSSDWTTDRQPLDGAQVGMLVPVGKSDPPRLGTVPGGETARRGPRVGRETGRGFTTRALNQRIWSKRRKRIWSERFRVTDAHIHMSAARRRSK